MVIYHQSCKDNLTGLCKRSHIIITIKVVGQVVVYPSITLYNKIVFKESHFCDYNKSCRWDSRGPNTKTSNVTKDNVTQIIYFNQKYITQTKNKTTQIHSHNITHTYSHKLIPTNLTLIIAHNIMAVKAHKI